MFSRQWHFSYPTRGHAVSENAEKATAHPPPPWKASNQTYKGVVWPFAIFSYSILFAPSLPSGHVEQFITEGWGTVAEFLAHQICNQEVPGVSPTNNLWLDLFLVVPRSNPWDV